MASFVTNLVETFVEKKFNPNSNNNNYQDSTERISETETTYNSNYEQGPPPNVPYPWRPRWDDRDHRYIFVHEQTGEQIWEYEEVIRRTQTTQQYGGGSYGQQYGERSYEQQSSYEQQQSNSSGGGHGLAYGALGGVAGLAAGAGLMYEGEKIHNDYEQDKYRVGNDYEQDKYRVENDYDQDKYRVENDVENFPENAAQWTGNKVGEVEAIPQDIEYDVDRFGNRVENGFDNAVTDVVDAPERMSGWVGDKVGDVERFDDNVDNAYDQGRYQGRNDGY